MLDMLGRLQDDSIVVEATAGLGNRMLALEGAILLGRKLGRQVFVSWPRSGLCHCWFKDLFELPNSNFKVLRHPAQYPRGIHRAIPRMVAVLNREAGRRLSRKWQEAVWRRNYRFDAVLKPGRRYWSYTYKGREIMGMPPLEELASNKRIFISSYYNFYEEYEPDAPARQYDYLRPNAKIRKRLARVTRQFSSNTVGVHIRWGTDEGWERRKHYPLSAFIKAMRTEMERNSSTQFFLSTTSPQVASRLKTLFGSRIIAQPDAVTDTSSIGMKSAAVDMWALGQTRKVIGSFASSFSAVASRLEQAELQMVDVLARKAGKEAA